MNRAHELNVEIELDRSLVLPLYQQIADAIRRQVVSGKLRGGAKLPASRVFAGKLGIHRRTVVQAFHLLETEGWVVSGIGQGTFVADQASVREAPGSETDRPAPSGDGEYPARFSWETILRRRPGILPDPWRYWSQGREAANLIRFTGATADPSFFPADDFRAILDEVFRDHGPAALDYGPAEGYAPLREWVVERLAARGVAVEPDQVLIVTGSQQGLDLISRLLIREGDTALVEEPAYTNGFRLFQTAGARVLGVPMDGGGLRCDALDSACRAASPRLLYLMPIFQNPTGLCLDEDRVSGLLESCARYSVPIVEDQFDADLFYEGDPPWPVKARDSGDLVILLGSFSKILFPGLRLGWLVAPRPLLAPLRELKQMSDLSTGLLAQLAMNLYCRRGLLDCHLSKVREVYGARRRALLSAMQEHFPEDARWTVPRGGLTLWVTLPRGADSLELLDHARRQGVDFSPGPFFYPNGGGSRHLRLSYVRETEDRIGRGIAVLGSLIRNQTTRARAAPAAGPFF